MLDPVSLGVSMCYWDKYDTKPLEKFKVKMKYNSTSEGTFNVISLVFFFYFFHFNLSELLTKWKICILLYFLMSGFKVFMNNI